MFNLNFVFTFVQNQNQMGILKIQDVCKEKGLTMQDLSKRLDISYQAMYASVSGNPTMERLQQIADALGVHITDLFEREPENIITCPKCGTKLEIKQKNHS